MCRASDALEVGDQHFDRRRGQAAAQLGDGAGENLGAAVGKVVAVHARDHDELEPHLRDGLGQPRRLVQIERLGRAVRHRAVGAVARAHVAQNHERRGLVLPTFTDVGAVGFLADGVQLEVAHQAFERDVVSAPGAGTLSQDGLRSAGAACCPRRGVSWISGASGMSATR